MLASDQFNSEQEVYLPLEAKASLPPIRKSQVSFGSSTVTPHRVEMEVKAEEPALVVIAQSFYHSWRCQIDGQPTRIWRANHGFQAVQVPPGSHHISLAYHDNTLLAGAGLSLAALLICGCVWKLNPRPL